MNLIFDSFVQDVKTLVDNVESFFEFILFDHQWRIAEHVVPSHQSVQSILQQEVLKFAHSRVSSSVVRNNSFTIFVLLDV